MQTFLIGCAVLISFYFLYKKNQASSNHPAIKLIGKTELQQAIQENPRLQLVDVRKPMEFKMGNIKPAVNIDVFRGDFVTQFKKYNKEEPLYLYCRSGARSNSAAHMLAKEGFTEIYDLKGGYLAWK